MDKDKIPHQSVTNIVHQVISGDYQGSTAIGGGNISNIKIRKGEKIYTCI